MSKDEIIAMAREAGGDTAWFGYDATEGMKFFNIDRLAAFADLVAAKEREECAQLAMEFRRGAGDPVCGEVAAAIRARSAHVT